MELPLGVLAVYGALAVWVVLLARGFRTRSFGPFFALGIGLLLVLNGRYFVEGAPAGIAFFIGIYDVLNNLGLTNAESPDGFARCVDNACTVWGDRYQNHSSWGVAFYDRFLNGPALRSNLLYSHIAFNSIAFVLMHVQMLRPGSGANPGRHRLLGRVTFGAITLGTVSALWLASEHGSVSEYGGALSMWGFFSMSAFVYACAVMTVVTVRRGDHEGHRKWSIRFAGSMWGSFWLFRAMLLVLDPLFRNSETVAILLCIWLSAPLGIAIAEFFGRRSTVAGGPKPERQPVDSTTAQVAA